MRQRQEPQIFMDATDFRGLSTSIRSIRENLRFLLVAETMINAKRFFKAQMKSYLFKVK